MLATAVGQGDFGIDHPYDITGERRHLLRAQSDTGCELEGGGTDHTAIHQCFVLCFSAALAIQEFLASQLGNLVVDQFLFIETIPQPLLRHGWVHGQAAQHVVAAKEGLVVGKPVRESASNRKLMALWSCEK